MNMHVQAEEKLIDQKARDRFTQEIDVNFSVIAPAGVGKTTAIVQRIITIASSCDFSVLPSKLSKLVVVTYTQKAADELRMRSYQALLKANVPPQCFQEFNKAFFGTIHSFCLKMIQSYGPQIGIPCNPSLLNDDTDLWREFLGTDDSFVSLIPEGVKSDLCKHVSLGELSRLARDAKPGIKISPFLGNCPRLDFSEAFNYMPKRSSQKVLDIQNELRQWWMEYQGDGFALELPEITQGDSDFKDLCAKTLSLVWHWLGDASLSFVIRLAQKYQEFRVRKGFINYDDMIGLAAKLLEVPYVVSAIRTFDYHVILDEAQDTDSEQFAVLLGITREGLKAPCPGRFCMLGDPQQAIYSSRTDLSTYLKVHMDLLSTNSLKTVTFSVTMRCDRKIVAHCNELFPSILKTKITVAQVDFVRLSARPWAEEGIVNKIQIDLPEGGRSKLNTSDLEKYEATILAHKIRELNCTGLGVEDWSEVAIIAPRKSWLKPIADALRLINIPAQIHSHDDIQGDNPAVAWLTALCVIMCSPNESFELVGVLRDLFGISDDEIACFIKYWNMDKGCKHPLNISEIQDGPFNDPINQALKLLHDVRTKSVALSLSEAVRNIVEEVGLKNRLASLPGYDARMLLDCLDRLLIKATIAEEEGLSLAKFTEVLKTIYNTSDEPGVELKGHVQLYTSHKAKGLEWTVVIVPFVFRSILFPPQEYPQLINVGNEHVKIAVSDHPDKKEWDALREQNRIAELERLLYVTATRARNKLLWVDDELLFTKPKNAFASLLKVTQGGINRGIWNDVKTDLAIILNHGDYSEEPSQKASHFFVNQRLSFDPVVISKAKDYSKNFIRSIAPSRLNKTSLVRKAQKNYSPIAYGNWWHRLMEGFPWNTDRIYWDAHFRESLSNCPEPLRGGVEFQLFIESPFIEKLMKDGFDIHTEVPFLFKGGSDVCYEGIIDFIVYDSRNEEFLIIDWKTDLINDIEDNLLSLREQYSNQLSIYKQVIDKLYGKNTKTFIFSTCLGKLIDIH